MKRLFVALDFPEDWKRQIATICDPLPGVRWVAPSLLHLTLQFLGDVDDEREKEVRRELSLLRSPAFSIAAAGVGAFPSPKRARVVWVGLERCEPLAALQRMIGESLTRVGYPPEDRPFSPHVTIGRVKTVAPDLPAFVTKHAGFRLDPVEMHRFQLFSSRLTSKGSIYTVEQEFLLEESRGS